MVPTNPNIRKYQQKVEELSNQTLIVKLKGINEFWNDYLEWAPDNIAFKIPGQEELIKDKYPSAYEMLMKSPPTCDCSGHASTKYEMALALGLEPYFVIGRSDGLRHAWVECSNYILDNETDRVIHIKNRPDLLPLVRIHEEKMILKSRSKTVVVSSQQSKLWVEHLRNRVALV